jgi:hypothetical protein
MTRGISIDVQPSSDNRTNRFSNYMNSEALKYVNSGEVYDVLNIKTNKMIEMTLVSELDHVYIMKDNNTNDRVLLRKKEVEIYHKESS